ncbi:MAG: tRNA preQ1(34) S-adenosylmethionine ribosyltransferase-isomerase QueA [Alphaproteobacteria bacterium]|nr:tRNA preQ1(34) S-adenosylmethionine ribosyltransferase-isomerase QueA [Alphaproteobacteria bacterium]
MRIEFFDYQLADAAIARSPAEPRGSSRLFVLGSRGEVEHRKFAQLPQFLRAGDILVLNDTRVIPARLTGWRAPRSLGMAAVKIEVTLHQRVAPPLISPDSEPKSGEAVTWKALVRPLKRLLVGDTIEFAENFAARVTNRGETGEVTLAFPEDEPEFWRKLSATGKVPLPPYLRREAESLDEANYQTVFAKKGGAVAAPTAGLHFTPELLQQLEAMGVRLVYITLHVGAGTFLPVTVADTNLHRMHSEWAELSEESARLINDGRAAGARIVAVGTTSLRVLESASDDSGRVSEFRQATNLFIQPGYRFKIVDLLITNFHVPRSSLLILVAALVGRKRILAAYELAMQLGYRFYSYGDACLLFRRTGEPEEDYSD